jgi:murein DD-endopeptidase MepM/ murein hydrolase activator NlpD
LALALAACAQQRPAPPARPAAPVVRPVPVPAASVVAPKPQRPTWTARRVIADAVEVPASTVTVAPGDSLSRIAARTGTGIGALAAANRLTPPYVIEPGQRLQVPVGRYHRVKEGETGIAIARAYGADWDRVIADNRLAAPFVLRAGDRLRLPSARAVAAMTLEQRAAAFRLDIDDLISGSEPAAKPSTKPAATAKAAAPKAGAVPRPVAEPATFAGRFAWPLEGRIISAFGPKPGGRYNDGINIKASAGDPVRAAADGVVAYAGEGIEGFGGLVLLKHGDNWVTAYAHNEALLVARGQKITKGQIIARAGATGSVDEPQLHFEIRRGRTPVDPAKHLPARGAS